MCCDLGSEITLMSFTNECACMWHMTAVFSSTLVIISIYRIVFHVPARQHDLQHTQCTAFHLPTNVMVQSLERLIVRPSRAPSLEHMNISLDTWERFSIVCTCKFTDCLLIDRKFLQDFSITHKSHKSLLNKDKIYLGKYFRDACVFRSYYHP